MRVFPAGLPLAQMIEAEVGDDPVNPGIKRALEAEIPDMAIGLQEGFLEYVLASASEPVR